MSAYTSDRDSRAIFSTISIQVRVSGLIKKTYLWMMRRAIAGLEDGCPSRPDADVKTRVYLNVQSRVDDEQQFQLLNNAG